MWSDFNTLKMYILGFLLANTKPFLVFAKRILQPYGEKFIPSVGNFFFIGRKKYLYRYKNIGFEGLKKGFGEGTKIENTNNQAVIKRSFLANLASKLELVTFKRNLSDILFRYFVIIVIGVFYFLHVF